jgi:hypothetical protein
MSAVNCPMVVGIDPINLFPARNLSERVNLGHFIVNTNTYNSVNPINCPIVDGIDPVNPWNERSLRGGRGIISMRPKTLKKKRTTE